MVMLKGELDELDEVVDDMSDEALDEECDRRLEDEAAKELESEASEPQPAPAIGSNLARDIAATERECQLAEAGVLRCKAALKSAKADYDECVMSLRELARSIANDESRPMMEMFEAAEGDEPAKDDTAPADGWRTSPISELGFPAGLLAKFEEENIATIGDLEDMREQISLGNQSWPKGIGPAKITLIEDRVIEWLGDWSAGRQEMESTDDEDDRDQEEDGDEAEDQD